MQRLKLGLLCLSWICLAGAVSAQTAVDPTGVSGIASTSGTATVQQDVSGGGVLNGTYFDIRHVIGDGVGYQNSYSQIGAFTPFWFEEDTIIAPNARLIVTNSTQTGVNAGLVARRYVNGLDRLFGVYGYYDNDQDSRNFRYEQFTIGAETLGTWWDLRANGYIVGGNNDHFINQLGVSGNPYYVGNNIDFLGKQLRDQAMGGADIEAGIPLTPATPWLRGYSGAYGYRVGSGTTIGYRGRIEATVSNDLTLGVVVSQDSIYGTNVNGTIDFKFSGYQPTRYFPNMSTRQRMLNSVQRNWRIATRTYVQDVNVAAINPETNKPYFVAHVDNSNPNPGDGTIENPYHNLTSAPQADIILVHLGNATTAANSVTGSAVLTNNQRLLGDGVLSTVNLFAHYGNETISGIFNLPGTSNSGNFAYVKNPAGNAVTLANYNEVAGLNLIGSSGSAITNTASGSHNFNLHDLEIANNGGKGIGLTSASGIGIISNINTGTTNHANPLGLGNNTGGGIVMSTGGPGLNLALQNVFMNANPVGSQAVGVSLAANLGSLNVNMNNVFTNGNTTGIFLSESSQLLTANMNLVRSNNNAGVGVKVQGTGGEITINANNIAAMNNGLDNLQLGTKAAPIVTSTVKVALNDANFNGSTSGSGIVLSQSGGTGALYLPGTSSVGNAVDGLGIYGSNNSVQNVSVINGQFMGNGQDAFHVEGVSGALVNLFVDPTNASGSGRDGLFYSMGTDSTLNATFLNNSLDNSNRSAVYGVLANGATANLYFDGTTGSRSGADGFYLDATNGSTATINVLHGTFAGSNRLGGGGSAININSDRSTIGLLTNMTQANNFLPGAATIGNQEYGLKLNLQNSSVFSGAIQNGNLSDNVVNAINVTVANTSDAVLSIYNTPSVRSGGDGFVANVTDNSTLTTNFRLSDLNNSGLNGVKLNVANNSRIDTTFDASNINNSGADGINATVTGTNSVATVTLTNGSTVNNSGGNGLNFNVDAGMLNVTAQSSSFSNSGLNGVLGTVTNTGLAGLDFSNTAVNSNGDNGVFVTANNGGIIQATFGIQSISNNGLNTNGDGIRLDLDGSAAIGNLMSFLQVINGASVSGNGNDGISILAQNGTDFRGIFGTNLATTPVPTSRVSILNNGAASPILGQNRAGVDVIASNSNVRLDFAGVTIGNTSAGGTQQVGFISDANTTANLTTNFTSTDLTNNAANAINSNVDSGSIMNMSLVTTTGNNSGNTGAVFNVTGGSTLNVDSFRVDSGGSMVSGGSSFSNNGGGGLLVSTDGTGSVSTFMLDQIQLNNNGGSFGGQGLLSFVTGGAKFNALIRDASSLSNNANQGLQVIADGAGTLVSMHVEESDVNNNGSEGLLISASNQAEVNYRSVNTNYNGNGFNGGLSGVSLTAVDNSTLRTLFNGGNANGNAGNGFTLDAQTGSIMTTSLNATSASNNGGYGLSASATGAATQFNLIMTGANTFTGNAQGPLSPLAFSNIDQAAIILSGTFNGSPTDGIRVDMTDVNNALVAVLPGGTINSSTLNGINVNMKNVGTGSVLVNGVTSINGSGQNGIRIAMDNVAQGAIGIQGPMTINNSGANAIDIRLTNGTQLVDNLTFGTANLSVLTMASDLASPLSALPAPVSLTFNDLGLVSPVALGISGVTANTSGASGINILADGLGAASSIQTLAINNNVIIGASGNVANTGDGIHFDLTKTPVTSLFLNSNQIGGAKNNGVNFDLNKSPIGTVNIAHNNIGLVNFASQAVGDNLPIILSGFNSNTLPAQDDEPSALASIGFSPNFFGTTYSDLWVNNNGNVTFNAALPDFTPFSLLTTATPMIAPFFADVDTRSGNPVTYGTGTVAGHAAFGVNWLGVEHYNGANSAPPVNTFQLVMIDRSDIAPGDFDFEFNYQSVLWESGLASGGDANGLGGSSARVGYSNGTNTSLELAGSAVNGALLDGGPAATSLIQNSLNSAHNGRYVFFVRDGLVNGPSPNGGDGIRLNATNGSDITTLNVVGNEIANAGKNGIEILQSASTIGSSASPISFTQNNIHNNAGDGIRLVNPTNGGALIAATFDRNTISANTGAGVNLTLVNGAQDLNASFTSNNISGNTGGAGVNIQLAANHSMTGGFDTNTISSNGAQGVNFVTGVDGKINSDFTNNVINGNGSDGIKISLATGAQYTGSSFYGNTIGTVASRNGGMGINLDAQNSNSADATAYLLNLGDATKAANLITGNTGAGVGITSTGQTIGTLNIANTTISNTTAGAGINFTGEGLRVNQSGTSTLTGSISNSTFTNNAADGAMFNVTGNDVGLFASLNNFTIDQSTFSSNAGNGLEFFRTADGEINNVTIANSVFNTNTQNGLVVRAANKFNGQTDTYTITNNDMSSNTGNGVFYDERADARIRADMTLNTINNNGGNGIQLVEQVNTASDLRRLSGTWTQNIITGNTGNGIAINGATLNLMIGDLNNYSDGNVISNNKLNGVEVTGAGSLSIGSNMIQGNGTLANLGTASENAGIMLNVAPVSNITVSHNVVSDNFGDGLQYGIRTAFDGGHGTLSIENSNFITNNSGRGIDIINRASNDVDINIDHNFVSANKLEGIYIVNTSSADQNQFSSSTTALLADGNSLSDPRMRLRIANGNQIIGNGLNSGLSGTGLVIRVGTSDGSNSYTDNGGFATTGADLTQDSSWATFLTTVSMTRGGIGAQIDSNTLGGNFGNDVLFHSFVSTTTPLATTQGTWTDTEQTITGVYQSDPLSRFDLYYRNNTTDVGALDSWGTDTGAYSVAPPNPALAAFFNDSDGVFKSRLNTITPLTNAGPFTTADRIRNATRQAAFPAGTAPNDGSNTLGFLYPGIGASTWRLDNTSDAAIQAQGGYFLNSGLQQTTYDWGSF
ncbi:beta strand repeat-containing protein [Schlesneria paludicola]|uniref:beta strand repeat-containing protein n=1 Tax=Schlesneria paludicola TaxID=360056 RepID=UPI00029A3250|nr:nidogen-like domain-containing protein [Schlesneria paludicola]